MEHTSDVFAHVTTTLDMLREAARETRILRITRPRATVAFSRQDELRPSFAEAVAEAELAGFATGVRRVGGSFAPMHRGSLVVEEFGWSAHPGDPTERYVRHTAVLVDILASYGIDARLGEVPGEYCPGAYSINRDGTVKLSGTAQRVARGAWLVSSVIQVEQVDALRGVTRRVATALDTQVDIGTIGAVADSVPDIAIEEVASRIARRFREDGVDEVELIGDLADRGVRREGEHAGCDARWDDARWG